MNDDEAWKLEDLILDLSRTAIHCNYEHDFPMRDLLREARDAIMALKEQQLNPVSPAQQRQLRGIRLRKPNG